MDLTRWTRPVVKGGDPSNGHEESEEGEARQEGEEVASFMAQGAVAPWIKA